MKVKVLSRNPDDYVRETKNDIYKVPRNYDPGLHPFEAAREYTRALNAQKLERVFAKPFVGSLEGHRDGVQCIAKHPKQLTTLISGSSDGEIRVWSVATMKGTRVIQAHSGFVHSICCSTAGDFLFSVGNDQTVKKWSLAPSTDGGKTEEAVSTILAKTVYVSIDHHHTDPIYATCGQQVDVWDEHRSQPLRSISWGSDSIHCLKFNPIETNLLASCAADRGIVLYDTRGSQALKRVVMAMKSNAVAWNPMESFIFTVANEDYNLYSYDLRRLDTPVNVHMDHVGAVTDLDYAPTGREFASGSYDKSIRIFPSNKGRSREVYHTKRMQHLSCIRWSHDNKYIFSGSDEMNIRVWKAKAWERLGVTNFREEAHLQYSEKLKEKYQHHPQVRRIARHRHVPRHIYSETKTQRIQKESKRARELNRKKHSKPGTVQQVAERKKPIVSISQ